MFHTLFISAVLVLISPTPICAIWRVYNRGSYMAEEQFNRGLETFGLRLFSELEKINPHSNIIFSPFSIRTCIAMARMGAEHETAYEIDQGLSLSNQRIADLANSYHDALAKYENSSILKIASKIYVKMGHEVREEFNETLINKFYSSVDAVNFAQSTTAAATINSWVESKTNNLITDLIAPESLDVNTQMVLINAIHFKGEWVHQFLVSDTRENDFYVDEINTVKAQMMHIKKVFLYGVFPELDATALEMPYKNSDLSLLIILPNSRTGLKDLEDKLKYARVSHLRTRMSSKEVTVDIPKFKAEFQNELTDPLKKLGIRRMFRFDAEFGKILRSPEYLYVSAVVHKAFIEVNEKGTEAAAATGISLSFASMFSFFRKTRNFNANRPFYYTLLNSRGLVIFQGHVKYL